MTICFFGTYHREYSRNQILLKGLKQIGIPVVEVHVPVTIMRLESKKHIGLLAVFHRLGRKVLLLPAVIKNFGKIRHCDVIFCAYPAHVDLPIAWVVAKLAGKPLIFDPLFSLTDVFTNDFKILQKHAIFAKLLHFFEKIIFSLPEIVLADTPYQKEKYHTMFQIPNERIRIVSIGADTGIYKQASMKAFARGPLAKPAGMLRVVYYGLYNPVHGVEYMIESAHILKNDKDIEFLMIGDGQTYEEMVALSKKYSLTNVRFLKLMEKDAILILQTADVFLGLFGSNESVFRAIPNKVLQGMAMGKAVITSSGPAIRSVFEQGRHVLLIEPANASILAEAIKKIKNSPELKKQLMKEGYKAFQEQFTPKAVAEQLLRAIHTI